MAAGGLTEGKYSVSETTVKGSELESLRYEHPFVESNPTAKDAYMVLLADYVTTEDGTGLVHTAPDTGSRTIFPGRSTISRCIRP